MQTSDKSMDYRKLIIALQVSYSGSWLHLSKALFLSVCLCLSRLHTHTQMQQSFYLSIAPLLPSVCPHYGWPLYAVVARRGRKGSKGYPWHWSCQSCSTELGHMQAVMVTLLVKLWGRIIVWGLKQNMSSRFLEFDLKSPSKGIKVLLHQL